MTQRFGQHVAVDLGASSGRIFTGRCCAGVLQLNEVHRFANGPVEYGTTSHWDVLRLWADICEGLMTLGGPVASIGVDAWGVDYALLGEGGELLQNPYHYRNPRNVSAMREVLEKVSKEDIYEKTGIQFMPINTLFQLYSAQVDTPELLRAAHQLILIPDLFHFWLSGNAVCEYTAASTTQFADPRARAWAYSLLERLDLPAHLPGEIVEPGTVVGEVISRGTGSALAGVPVIAPASHDTASAVVAITARDQTAFLSSGTWSLLGTETLAPVLTASALRLNFTNEGGAFGTTRLLKNVMGLWMLQGCCREWKAEGVDARFDEVLTLARDAEPLKALVDPDDPIFLNPTSMVKAIAGFCHKTDQAPPSCPASFTRTILESLALKYRLVLRDLETVTGTSIRRIHIIGGGSRNALLNQFTADATGREVIAGPVEATALGNLGVQMIACGEIGSLPEFRAAVERSFPLETFVPKEPERWDREVERFQQYCELSLEQSHA